MDNPIFHNCEQNSDEWYALRLGVPTASEFKKVLSGTGKVSTQLLGYAQQLAAEIIAGEPVDIWEGNEYTERGHELEDKARELYEFMTGNDVTECGFVTNGDFGASPDRLVGDDGLLEIKCLKGQRHVAACMYIESKGKVQPDYYSQLQGQLLVTGRKWADIVFYHPQLPHAEIRIHRDDEFIAALIEQLNKLIETRDKIVETLNEKVS